MLVLALDPGIHTGVAFRLDDIYTLTKDSPEGVFSLICDNNWDAVVYESFYTGNRINKYGLATVKLIGGIEALCWNRKINTYERPPQAKIAFISEAKRYVSREHEVDALAHLLSWEYKYAKS